MPVPEPYPELKEKLRPLAEPLPRPRPGDWLAEHPEPGQTFAEYLGLRLKQPHFANARSVRNALDRARLRQASRLFADRDRVLSADDLTTLRPEDIRASRVFAQS